MSGTFCSLLPKPVKKKEDSGTASIPTKGSFITTPRPNTPLETREKEPPTTRRISTQRAVRKFNASDCDIVYIDTVIKELLLAQLSTLPQLKNDLSVMLWILSNGTNADKVTAKEQIAMFRRRLSDLEFGFEYGYYLLRTEELIDEFKKLAPQTTNSSFVIFEAPKISQSEQRRNEIRSIYLNIAKEYVEITNLDPRSRKMQCECGATDFDYDEDSNYSCRECGVIVEVLDDAPSYKDTDRINMSSRYRYTLNGRFCDTMKKYQARQNKTILPRVIDTIKEEMERHRLSAEEVTKEHLYMFLHDNDMSSHYEDINLIHARITGIPAPDISQYEEELVELFLQMEDAYSKVKNPMRHNSVNVWYKLYKLMQHVGIPCSREDFYFLKTPTVQREHDQKMEEVWKLLGWEWIPT